MALQLTQKAVIGERYVAIFAARHPCTLPATHHRGISATVLEEYHLFSVVESLVGPADGGDGKSPFEFAGGAGSFHVYHFYFREFGLPETLQQFHQPEFSLVRLVIGLDGGSRRPEENFGAVEAGKHHGHIAGIIARCRVALLIAAVMLLVDYHKPEPGKWQKNRHAGTQHH